MDEKIINLGKFLQTARGQKGLTLRAAEKATGISNPYLSQLESGKIRRPSPVMLHKLSKLYDISYAEVLELTGYPVPNRSGEEENNFAFASRIGPLTGEEEDALIEYLEFLRAKRKRGGKR